jgi:hypothetical protein
MLIHFCCISIDAVFLLLWAAVNFSVNAGVHRLALDGADAIIGFVLQVLFGIATLVPVAIFIYRDASVMWVRAKKKITQEKTHRESGAR